MAGSGEDTEREWEDSASENERNVKCLLSSFMR